jgi:hypothetical protein
MNAPNRRRVVGIHSAPADGQDCAIQGDLQVPACHHVTHDDWAAERGPRLSGFLDPPDRFSAPQAQELR